MSHHRRLELRLLSRNSHPQFGQALSFVDASPESSDSAETASAASNASGADGSPNGFRACRCQQNCRRDRPRKRAAAPADAPFRCRRPRRRSETAGRPFPGLPGPAALSLRDRPLSSARPPSSPARKPEAADANRAISAGSSKRSKLRDGSPRRTTVFAVSSTSAPPAKRCFVQETAMRHTNRQMTFDKLDSLEQSGLTRAGRSAAG